MSRVLTAFLVLFTSLCFSQIDSLKGFSVSQTIIEAHQHGCEGSEAKFFVQRAKQQFLAAKFPQLNTPVLAAKYNTVVIASAPCIEEDFEALSIGNLSSSAWISQTSNNFSATSVPCATTAVTYTNNNAQAFVVSTPVTDGLCNNVLQSPLGGSRILQLNRNNLNTVPARVKQTFSVTNSNYIFQYAYKGVLNASGNHSCCEQPAVYFNFYDCSANLITSFCNTVLSGSCTSSADASFWSLSSTGVYYTPQWVLHTINLSSYLNSCVTVEIVVHGCIFGGHEGYVYYDALCSSTPASPMNLVYVDSTAVSSFSTCIQTPTIQALGGLNSYLWQGPSGSGINGSTLSAVTPSLSGNYTLTATSGTAAYTQTLALTINPVPAISVNGPFSICQGATVTLVASGSASSYSWSSGLTGSLVPASPSVTTIYIVTGSNSAGCTRTASTSVTVNANPSVSIFSPSTSICATTSLQLFASLSQGVTQLLWSNGSTSVSTIVSPTVTTTYTLTGTTAAGCANTATLLINVSTAAPVSINQLNPPACVGQQATLSASSADAVNYNWGFGPTASGLLTLYAWQNTTFTVVSTNSLGCKASASFTLLVYPIPQVSISVLPKIQCQGQPFTMTANTSTDVTSYLWSSGATTSAITVSHIFNIQYLVDVTNIFGCSSTAMIFINLKPVVGTLQAFIGEQSVCAGAEVIIYSSATNINSYLWSTGAITPTIAVYPLTTTVYTVTGIDTNGCIAESTETVNVTICTSLEIMDGEDQGLVIYPNPNDGNFILRSEKNCTVEITDAWGRLINMPELSSKNNFTISFVDFPKGIYFIKNGRKVLKVLVH